jgi:hypothetical protein
MKHKKLIVVAIVVVAMAVAATVAYAWWSTTITSDTNSVSTGSVAMEMAGLPVTASGLVPQANPAMDAEDAEYADVTYFWVKNSSSIPLMFYGWLSDGSDPKNIRSYVNVRIWLLGATTAPSYWTLPAGWVDTFQIPGPHETYFGTVGGLWQVADGINYLSSRFWTGTEWVRTPIGPGEYGVYRVAIWLDSTAPNSAQGATGSDALTFKINFTGMQDEAWTEANYDDTDKY